MAMLTTGRGNRSLDSPAVGSTNRPTTNSNAEVAAASPSERPLSTGSSGRHVTTATTKRAWARSRLRWAGVARSRRAVAGGAIRTRRGSKGSRFQAMESVHDEFPAARPPHVPALGERPSVALASEEGSGCSIGSMSPRSCEKEASDPDRAEANDGQRASAITGAALTTETGRWIVSVA
jgi:hypothetical protein